MDLSFSRLIPAADASLAPADLAALVAALSAQLADSVTAQAQAAIERPVEAAPLLAPPAGAFSAAMALRLADWRHQ